MRTKLLIVAALLVCAVTAAPAQAIIKTKRAYFTAKISGLQTTKWVSESGTYTDCNGTRKTKGEGTEVLRFADSTPDKITFHGFGSRTPTIDYDGWFRTPDAVGTGFHALADTKLTRHGQYVTSWSGGWCRGPRSEFSDISDCTQRKGLLDVMFDPYSSKRIRVEARRMKGLEAYDDCPINNPSGVTAGGWTDATGKLSSKLIFGKQKRIVVTGGKTYRRADRKPGVTATSTTYFKLTLVRHFPKRVPRGDVGAG